MLLLNFFNKKGIQYKTNLNTSNVTVKRVLVEHFVNGNVNLNTSNVTVKPTKINHS